MTAVAETVFAATTRAGLFKSTDGGGSWHSLTIPVSAARIVTLAIAPADPQTVYAGTGRGVFKTTDGGATWRAANDGLFDGKESAYEHEWRLSEGYVQTLVVDSGDAETVYAAIHQRGVFKSTNGGANWVRVNRAAVRSLILDRMTARRSISPQTAWIGTRRAASLKRGEACDVGQLHIIVQIWDRAGSGVTSIIGPRHDFTGRLAHQAIVAPFDYSPHCAKHGPSW